MAVTIKNARNAPRMTHCNGNYASADKIEKDEIRMLEKFWGIRFMAGSYKRCMVLYTIINSEVIEFPVVRAIPLEHTCPPECYRIHLTTTDPEGEAI